LHASEVWKDHGLTLRTAGKPRTQRLPEWPAAIEARADAQPEFGFWGVSIHLHYSHVERVVAEGAYLGVHQAVFAAVERRYPVERLLRIPIGGEVQIEFDAGSFDVADRANLGSHGIERLAVAVESQQAGVVQRERSRR